MRCTRKRFAIAQFFLAQFQVERQSEFSVRRGNRGESRGINFARLSRRFVNHDSVIISAKRSHRVVARSEIQIAAGRRGDLQSRFVDLHNARSDEGSQEILRLRETALASEKPWAHIATGLALQQTFDQPTKQAHRFSGFRSGTHMQNFCPMLHELALPVGIRK
jgi:hypothetical protein